MDKKKKTNIIPLENFDFTKLKLGKSGRAVKLLYGDSNEPFQISTSTFYCPFGVKSINKEWSNFQEYNVDCYINNSSNEKSVAFKTFIETLDASIQKLAMENLHLFGGNKSSNTSYSSILRENGSYPKLIKIQLPRDKNGNFETVLFDNLKNKIPITEDNINELLSKGKIFRCILECSKIWFYNDKIGSIWNCAQIKLSEKKMPSEKVEQTNVISNLYTTLLIDD